MDSIPQKICTSCKQSKPATKDFFYFTSRDHKIYSWCIQCYADKHALKHPPKPTIEGMKQCTDCKEFLPATTDYFAKQSKVKSGLRGQCKECRSTQRKAHRAENREVYRAYEQAGKEKHREASRKHHATHREEYRRAGREYAKAHAEERSAYLKAHPEQRKVTLQKYAKNHPDEYRVRKHRRRASISRNGGSHSQSDIRKQYANQKGKCYYCKANVGTTYHVDHVIPLAKGGSNGPENLVIACPTCNMRKRDKIIRLL